jgi:uncharacterized protein (TIGR00369 family)
MVAESGPRSGERFGGHPLHRFFGLTLEEARPGYARMRLDTSPNVIGGVGGSVHGGVLAALVDIAMLEALFPALTPSDEPAGTADLAITYLRPAFGPSIWAEAEVLRKGRQLAVVEVAISNGEGALCAKGRVLYALRQRER